MPVPVYRLFTSRYNYGTLIPKILENHPGAQFVEEVACKTVDGGYSDLPALVFFQEKLEKPEYTPFFGYHKVYTGHDKDGLPADGKWYITGLKTFDPIVTAMLDETDEGGILVISRYGHDFVRSPISERCIDGGRNYTRLVGTDPITVKFNLLDKSFNLRGRKYYATRY